jgi:hypothetical protein
LPSDCANDFYDALKEGGFLAASGYLVNVSQGQYYMMKKNGLVLGTDEYGFIEQVDVPYTSETGLDIAAALQQRDEDV